MGYIYGNAGDGSVGSTASDSEDAIRRPLDHYTFISYLYQSYKAVGRARKISERD